MSDDRKRVGKLVKESPEGWGTPRIVIEIFKGSDFKQNYSVWVRQFYPKVPFDKKGQDEYWRSLYRVRINGKWFCSGGKYHLLTKKEVYELFEAL